MKYTFDLEAKLYMRLLSLVEDKNKTYLPVDCDYNIVYVFNNYNEYKSYFLTNGLNNVSEEILERCVVSITKKGSVIALKNLCDRAIRRNNNKVNKEDKEKILMKCV